MATNKKPKGGLGMGLEALLGPRIVDASDASGDVPHELRTDQLQPGKYQPRSRMDEGALYELADSIRLQGVMQPLLVRRLESGRYEVIAGERRWRAAELAGLTTVPVLVRDASDRDAAAMALIENMQREDLNPLEEAQGIARLVQEFKLSHDEAAHAVGRSRSAASNLLRLLNLTPAVQQLLMAGDLDMGHARALLPLDAAAQVASAHQIVARKMSVRDAERLAARLVSNATPATPKPGAVANGKERAALDRIEQTLSDLLSSTVEIRVKSRGGPRRQRGEVAIRFESLDGLNGVLERLGYTEDRAESDTVTG